MRYRYERPEIFLVNVSDPKNATVADGQGQGTIRIDDRKRRP